jgi:hypothetical protein
MSNASLTGSPVLLYGILAAEAEKDEAFEEVLRQPGIQGAPLNLLSCDSLAVLASSVEDPSALRRADVDTVLAYKEIIEATYAARTLVPLRFGTWTSTPAHARVLVQERAAACREQLDRLAGRVEMGLRLILAPESDSEETEEALGTSSGTAYLQARKEARARGQALRRRALRPYRDALSSLAADSTVDHPASEERVVSVAFLVPRQHVEVFTRRAFRVQPPSVQDTQVVGPWAPFTFASLSL